MADRIGSHQRILLRPPLLIDRAGIESLPRFKGTMP